MARSIPGLLPQLVAQIREPRVRPQEERPRAPVVKVAPPPPAREAGLLAQPFHARPAREVAPPPRRVVPKPPPRSRGGTAPDDASILATLTSGLVPTVTLTPIVLSGSGAKKGEKTREDPTLEADRALVSGVGGLGFQTQSPPGAGRLVRIPCYPSNPTQAWNGSGGIDAAGDDPILDIVIPAGFTTSAKYTIQTYQFDYGTYKVLGLQSNFQGSYDTGMGAPVVGATVPPPPFVGIPGSSPRGVAIAMGNLALYNGQTLFVQLEDADASTFQLLPDYEASFISLTTTNVPTYVASAHTAGTLKYGPNLAIGTWTYTASTYSASSFSQTIAASPSDYVASTYTASTWIPPVNIADSTTPGTLGPGATVAIPPEFVGGPNGVSGGSIYTASSYTSSVASFNSIGSQRENPYNYLARRSRFFPGLRDYPVVFGTANITLQVSAFIGNACAVDVHIPFSCYVIADLVEDFVFGNPLNPSTAGRAGANVKLGAKDVGISRAGIHQYDLTSARAKKR